MKDDLIILFDGYCNLCNTTLRFIIKRDKKKEFQYFPLQSQETKNLLEKLSLPELNTDTVILVEKGKVYYKSDAILHILNKLGKGYKLLLVFRILPKQFRDKVYDWIASNRYKWFGKKDQCGL